MEKRILRIAIVAIFAVMSTIGVNLSTDNKVNNPFILRLSNVEALAAGETIPQKIVNKAYEEAEESVKDQCPDGQRACIDVETQISYLGLSVGYTFHFYKK